MAKYKSPNGEIIELSENHTNLAERNGLELVIEIEEKEQKGKAK